MRTPPARPYRANIVIRKHLVVLNYQGRSGDLVPIAASFDETGRYGLQTPFSEGVAHLWKGSVWHVDNFRNSLITTGNGGTEPTHAAITLFYNNGKSRYTIEKQLAPGEQIWANVGDIIRNQIPDKNGKTIPPDVMMGPYELRDLDHIGVGYLYEGKLIVDKSWGHGYYGCAGCCGYETPQLNLNPNAGGVGTGANNSVELYDVCTASWVDDTAEAYNWASTNTGIVTLANAYSSFISPGSATGSAEIQFPFQSARMNCPVHTYQPQNEQNAQPSVTVQVQTGFLSTAGNGLVLLAGSGGIGSTAITAVGKPSGGSYSWTAGPNLQISGVNSANASVSGIGPSKSAGDTYVSNSYTLSGQTGAASVRFTVLNPTTLNASNYKGGPKATTPYNSGSYSGYITVITYYAYDQMSPANPILVPGIPFTEVLSTTSNPYGAILSPPDGTPRTIYSNSDGQMPDWLYAYGQGGLPSGFSASRSQSLTANGFPFSPAQQQSYTSTSATISVQYLHR